MANFNFSLQQVLHYREQLKDQAQVVFAKAQADVNAEEKRAQILQSQINEATNKLSQTPVQNQGERWLLDNFLKGLRQDLFETNSRLVRLQDILRDARQKLAIAAKEHKVLEKLKEKQALKHALNLKIQEQKTYDETSALRYKNTSI